MAAPPLFRDSQLSLLSLLLPQEEAEHQQLPEAVLVQGVEGTGKTSTLRWHLASASLPHAFVPELLPAPEIREFSRIRSFSGNNTENGTENSVLLQNWSKMPQKASK